MTLIDSTHTEHHSFWVAIDTYYSYGGMSAIVGRRVAPMDVPRVKLIDHIQHLNQMLVAYILLLTTRNSACRTNDILDLPPVHLLLPELLQLTLCEARILIRFAHTGRVAIDLFPRLYFLQQSDPDLPLCIRGEVWIEERDVYT